MTVKSFTATVYRATCQVEVDKATQEALQAPSYQLKVLRLDPLVDQVWLSTLTRCNCGLPMATLPASHDYKSCGPPVEEMVAFDWIYVRGDFGKGKDSSPLRPQWVKDVWEKCRDTNTPFHFAGWGDWYPMSQMMFHTGNPPPAINQAKEHRQCFRVPGDEGERFALVGPVEAGRQFGGATFNGRPKFIDQELLNIFSLFDLEAHHFRQNEEALRQARRKLRAGQRVSRSEAKLLGLFDILYGDQAWV